MTVGFEQMAPIMHVLTFSVLTVVSVGTILKVYLLCRKNPMN
ncbi:hypothetical protein [Effusibacillus lacus]|nr:hypothetical protein [Effusibacillus lacus]TCS71452.1 hypothetical protein EDD64_12670 [Effusibacillus lacus]